MTKLLLNNNILKQKRIYTRLFERYKISHKSLHWSERKSQHIRFEQFLKVGDLRGKSVLDIGCGLGCFYAHLEQKGIECDYLGVDIVPQFIQSANKLYPNAKFIEQNIFTRSIEKQFDYVFASGIFAFGNRLFFEKMNKTAFGLAKKAWVYNIYFPHNDSRFLDLTRSDLIRSIRSLYPSKTHYEEEYLDRDMTIFIYK